MGKVIYLEARSKGSIDNLITSEPLEFRRSNWGTAHYVQMLKSQSVNLEYRREENHRKANDVIQQIPSHFSLKGGMAYTIRAMYAYREHEDILKKVYYLAGLMDCMINQVSPVLRTDLIRSMYNSVLTMKQELNIHWYGPLDHVLLPIDPQFFNELSYRASLSGAHTMKELYQAIREGTEEMFHILSLKYVFYRPGIGGRAWGQKA